MGNLGHVKERKEKTSQRTQTTKEGKVIKI